MGQLALKSTSSTDTESSQTTSVITPSSTSVYTGDNRRNVAIHYILDGSESDDAREFSTYGKLCSYLIDECDDVRDAAMALYIESKEGRFNEDDADDFMHEVAEECAEELGYRIHSVLRSSK